MAALTSADIDRLRADRENRNLEFKAARNNFSRDDVKNYSVALANEGGGYLLLGIDDATRNVVGSNAFGNVPDTEHWLYQAVGFRVVVDEVAHPQGRVVAFVIPSRPRGVAYHIGGAYLMRSGASMTGMTSERLKAILNEVEPHWGTLFTREGVSEQEVVDLLDTQTFFELLGLPYPTIRDGVIDRLLQHELIDRGRTSYSITRLGALLLAKRLGDFPEVARHAPRVVTYVGEDKLATRSDETGRTGYAVGFPRLVAYVMQQQPGRQELVGALREERHMVPEDVIRELVANSLIHQDLTIDGASPMVEIYSNRVEITNPGDPVVDTNRFIDGYESRNDDLAGLMRLFRICEEKGSGIDRVVATAEANLLPPPDFRAGFRRTHVLVFGPRAFSDMTIDERVRAAFQHCAIQWVKGDHMTNQSLRLRFGLDETRVAPVSQVIAAAIDAKLVKADSTVGGSRKYARYVPFWG